MGKTYSVPRSVKGETRVLIIFTIKSFISTVVLLIIGFLITNIIGNAIKINLLSQIMILGVFGLIGFGLGSLKIPDNAIMGRLRTANGEEISTILFRAVLFRFKRKIYIYNLNRGKIKDDK